MKLGVLAVAVLVACSGDSKSPPPVPPVPPEAPATADAMPLLQATAVLSNAGSGSGSDAAPVQVPVEAPARKLWRDKIEDEATFVSFSKQLGNEQFAKFIINLKTDAIYYFDVDVYAVHKDFIFQELYKKPKTKEAVRVFDRNYTENKVDFMMCYLVHHLSQDAWTFAFWDGDRATAEHVTHAYKRMKETFYNGDKVKFRPDSDYQEAVAKKLVGVPYINNDQLYQAATYVAFNKGRAIGTLRQVPPNVPESELTFDPGEVVILETPLADITPVAGIISQTFSTPLAHVSLRARGWGIPNIGLKDAATKLAPLVGKTVLFEATDAGYTLREATATEIADDAAKHEAARTVKLPVPVLDRAELAPLDALTAKDIVAYGAKTANLGEILHAKDAGIHVPPGFGIPFHFYVEHMRANKLLDRWTALQADPAFHKDANVRKAKLAELRKAIVDAPVSQELDAAIATALDALTNKDATVGVFVRSSGNAEDL
ncbi:MAG TPA: PEP/pyruvate-binding domain-containing protein, partial [Kofleriaceae bacterium]|nr:PEP/pyruvate-binding domain-containing protein [Kofleriaceae bacterium]